MYSKRTDELSFEELWNILEDMTPNLTGEEREDLIMDGLGS